MTDTADYEERATYLLAAFCSDMTEIQETYREMTGEGGERIPPAACLPLDGEFPCPERFYSPAAYYLAAMLVIEENPDFSDRLFARYSDAISTICESLHWQASPIEDLYGV